MIYVDSNDEEIAPGDLVYYSNGKMIQVARAVFIGPDPKYTNMTCLRIVSYGFKEHWNSKLIKWELISKTSFITCSKSFPIVYDNRNMLSVLKINTIEPWMLTAIKEIDQYIARKKLL